MKPSQTAMPVPDSLADTRGEFSLLDKALVDARATAHKAMVTERALHLGRWRSFATAVFTTHVGVLTAYFTLDSWKSDPVLLALVPTLAILTIIVTLIVVLLLVKDRQHTLDEGVWIETAQEEMLGASPSNYFRKLDRNVGFWGFTDLHVYQLILALIWIAVFTKTTLL